MKSLWFSVLLLLATAVSVGAQIEPPFAPGLVSEHVATLNDASQTYAIYLPKAYDPKKAYPLLYAFDPGGHGVGGVLAYRAAAEKYGYIVVGSNNSKNGLDGTSLTTALRTLWQDTHQRLSIDDKRVTATGFSGGARVATSFANACACAFAVIGSGAGFSRGVPIDKKLPFIYLATVGVDDFNYPELRDLQKKLTAVGVVNRLLTFDGSHQWPPQPTADEAIRWLEIRAMKTGLRGKDDAFIDAVLRDRDASGDALLAAKDYLGAHEAYASAIDDLTGLRDVSAISKKLAALEAIQEYKRALKADADAIDKQAKLSADINNVAQGLTATDTRVEALGKIRSQVGDLRVHFSDPADSPERRLARRVLNAVFVEAYESATLQYEPAKNYDMALVELELAGAVSPKSAEVPYQQARISALKGDKKKALQFLRKALENGFHNIDRIKAETAFETLRSDPDFQSILSSKLTTD